jgi:4-hydroxybenzoate polyprenyltransferase
MQRLKDLLDTIKFEHTIFAMPFALLSLFLASNGWPRTDVLLWVLVAMVGARSTAMMMNRIADRHIDARNPRTANRQIPSGVVSLSAAWCFTLITAALFVGAASQLNTLTLQLAPLALAVVWAYSWTKRFTWAAHLWLGASLGLAPLGAWIAATGQLAVTPVLIGVGVLLWVAGFDTIYSCQDASFDRQHGLHSLPARWGTASALRLARLFHTLMLVVFLILGVWIDATWLYWGGWLLVAGLVIAQHRLVNPDDLSHIDIAFFNVNSIVGVLLLVFTLADRFLLG